MVTINLISAAEDEDVTEDVSDERAECIMWSHLENKTMPLQDQGHATCKTNKECSGFVCEGQFKVITNN